MKKLFIPIFLLLISLSSCDKELIEESVVKIMVPNILLEFNNNDFKQRNGLFLYKNEPFSGYIFEKYTNDSIKRRSTYFKGKLVNWSRQWFNNGQLKFEKFYVNGKKQGTHSGWYKNGNPRFIFNYNDDVYEGYQVSYYKDGQLSFEKNYKKGHEEGQQKSWNDKGKLTSNYTFKNKKRYGIVGRKDCVSVFK